MAFEWSFVRTDLAKGQYLILGWERQFSAKLQGFDCWIEASSQQRIAIFVSRDPGVTQAEGTNQRRLDGLVSD